MKATSDTLPTQARPLKGAAGRTGVTVVGAMRNVMWKGELAGVIDLDTIADKKGLYGLGPVEYLTGEILIDDGQAYVSKVLTDSTMTVEPTFAVKAPFFVYANATEWRQHDLPENVSTIAELENYLDRITKTRARPFVFKLSGLVDHASIHIQNLPAGSVVRSPAQAHQGQTSYPLSDRSVSIVGFFSTEHQGIFTHHDSNVHLHLITSGKTQMGHLDEVKFRAGETKLYLPKN